MTDLPPIGPPGAAAHLDEDLCIDIVSGLAAGPETAAALEHIRVCPECEARLREAGGDHERARASGPAVMLVQGDPGAGARIFRLHRLRPNGVHAIRFGVPAALAAGVVLFLLLRPSPEAYWLETSHEVLGLRETGPNGADSLLWLGLDAYANRDVARAGRLLEQAQGDGGMEDLRKLHLASLRLNAGRPADALRLLADLDVPTLPQPWRDEAMWLEYLASVAEGRSERAREILRVLAERPGPPGDRAREHLGDR